MKKCILLFFISIYINIFSQESSINSDSLKIEIKDSYSVINRAGINKKNLVVDGITLKVVGIKIKITNKTKQNIPFSSFSLIDRDKKLRYRADDFFCSNLSLFGNKFIDSKIYHSTNTLNSYNNNNNLIKYRKEKLYTKNGHEIITRIDIPDLNPLEKDYFNDFSFVGINNLEFAIDFGSKKHPKKTILYLTSIDLKKASGSLEFRVPEIYLDSTYELYYGETKIGEIKF